MSSFAVTWDYRCPFARNVHEHVLVGLANGADWQVSFVPFSLGQVHVEEGAPSVWEQPEQDTGILALQVGAVIRDRHPGQFPDVHRGLFAARHDHGEHLEDEAVIRRVLGQAGLDPDPVFAQVAEGTALSLVQREHEQAARSADVWGVPTFIADGHSVYVRLMNRPDQAAPDASIRTINRIVDMVAGWPELNEFKHTTVPA